MKCFLSAVLGSMFVVGLGASVRAADDKDAQAILDKAIKALGGQEKLSKVEAATWKAKSKFTLNGGGEITTTVTVQGLDHYRSATEGEFDGAKLTVVYVLAKDKGWQRNSYNGTRELNENELAMRKQDVYFVAVPLTLMPLKGKGFKVEAAGEKHVGDKPAVGLKITCPNGKDFTLFFDKASGLPVLLTAKVAAFVRPGDFTMEATYANYKDFDGIKRATTIVWKRDGEKISESHITEFRVLDKIDPKTFEEPK
jgi:hypothetical protein